MLRLVAESLSRMEEYVNSMQAEKFKMHAEEFKMHEKEAESKKDRKPVIMNRYAIYECFMEHWLAKQEMRLAQSSDLSDK